MGFGVALIITAAASAIGYLLARHESAQSRPAKPVGVDDGQPAPGLEPVPELAAGADSLAQGISASAQQGEPWQVAARPTSPTPTGAFLPGWVMPSSSSVPVE